MRIIISLLIQPKIQKSYASTIFSEKKKKIFANFHVYFQCI